MKPRNRSDSIPGIARTSNIQESVSAQAVMSFLRVIRSELDWTAKDLSKILRIKKDEADQILATFSAQGYVKQSSDGAKWITTPPARRSQEHRRSGLRQRKLRTHWRLCGFESRRRTITKGRIYCRQRSSIRRFSTHERSRVRAADVGIELVERDAPAQNSGSLVESEAEQIVFRKLKARSASLRLMRFDGWMKRRTHISLI